MLGIRGIYEVAIRVRDLDRALTFYRDVLGLTVGLRDESRRWIFLRAGGPDGMLVLQEDPGDWPTQHLAFRVDARDLERAARQLKQRGISTSGPVAHDWMPAHSLYFEDPDGHELELCAVQ
jgi:catechol 2,3-dioxygenase-like lactoylglutathione lyase family enzyme